MRFEKRPAKTYSIRRRHNIGSRPNIHRELELAYMLSGQATVHVQGKEYPVTAGALALVFPNQAHFYTNDTENDNILLLCSPDEFPEFHAAFFQQLPPCPVVTPPAGLVVPLLERMLSLSEEGIGEDVFRQGQMRGYAMALIGIVLSALTLEPFQADPLSTTIQRLLLYCGTNYTEPITLETASTALYLSKYHICHIFQENLHTSFHQYITDLRLEKAKDLLAGTEDSIADISAQAGFGTIRGLNRQFLSKTGMTPTEYRSKKQK